MHRRVSVTLSCLGSYAVYDIFVGRDTEGPGHGQKSSLCFVDYTYSQRVRDIMNKVFTKVKDWILTHVCKTSFHPLPKSRNFQYKWLKPFEMLGSLLGFYSSWSRLFCSVKHISLNKSVYPIWAPTKRYFHFQPMIPYPRKANLSLSHVFS